MQKTFNTNKNNYNFQESQKLLSEVSILLANITKYVEGREEYIIYLEKQIKEHDKIRFLLKKIGRLVICNIRKRVSFVINKIKDKFKSYIK